MYTFNFTSNISCHYHLSTIDYMEKNYQFNFKDVKNVQDQSVHTKKHIYFTQEKGVELLQFDLNNVHELLLRLCHPKRIVCHRMKTKQPSGL